VFCFRIVVNKTYVYLFSTNLFFVRPLLSLADTIANLISKIIMNIMYDRAFGNDDDLPDIPVPPTQERILDPLPVVSPAKPLPVVKEVEDPSNSSDDDKPCEKPSKHAEAETTSEKSEGKPVMVSAMKVLKRTEVIKRERKLSLRENAVSKREIELAKRESELAKRESEEAKREVELNQKEISLTLMDDKLNMQEKLVCQKRDSYRKWFESIKSEQEGLVVQKQTLFKLMATLHSELGKTATAVASLDATKSSVSEPVYPDTTDVPNQRKEKRDEIKETISKKAKK